MITQKDADKVNKKLNDTNFWENGDVGECIKWLGDN